MARPARGDTRAGRKLKDALMSLQHRTEPVEAGPESWSDYWDLYTWEISDPTEVAALEAETSHRDAFDPDPVPGTRPWITLMVAGSLPPVSGGAPEYTDADRDDLEAWLEQADDYPPANQISPDELAMAAAGLALG
jgi:hypothetical protein